MTDYLYLEISYDCSLYMVQEHKAYDGTINRTISSITGAKGFWSNAEDRMKVFHGLIIPCDRSVTDAIQDFLRLQETMRGASDSEECIARGPYYFSQTMECDYDFETPSASPPLFGGPHTAYAPQFRNEHEGKPERNWFVALLFGEAAQPQSCERNEEGIRLARYNCWTKAQGIAQYIGGIDLGAICPELATSFRAAHATDVFQRLKSTASAGYDPTLRADHLWGDSYIIRREGQPPVIAVDSIGCSFDRFMGGIVGNSGETLAQLMAREAVFIRTAPEPQAHVRTAMQPA